MDVEVLTNVVLLISAAIALISLLYHISMFSRRTTWEYFSKYHLSEEWGKNAKRARFFLQKKSRQELSAIAKKWSDRTLEEESSDVAAVLLWLNRNEFIAIFLLNKTIHMKTYAQAWGWEYIYEWKLARDFIGILRETERGDPAIFERFEQLAEMKKFKKLSGYDDA